MSEKAKNLICVLMAAMLCGLVFTVMVAFFVAILGACTKILGVAATVACMLCGLLIVGMGLALIGGDEHEQVPQPESKKGRYDL